MTTAPYATTEAFRSGFQSNILKNLTS